MVRIMNEQELRAELAEIAAAREIDAEFYAPENYAPLANILTQA